MKIQEKKKIKAIFSSFSKNLFFIIDFFYDKKIQKSFFFLFKALKNNF